MTKRKRNKIEDYDRLIESKNPIFHTKSELIHLDAVQVMALDSLGSLKLQRLLDQEYIDGLEETYKKERINQYPILIVKNKDGQFTVVDGHHRVRAMQEVIAETMFSIEHENAYYKMIANFRDIVCDEEMIMEYRREVHLLVESYQYW